MCSGHLGSRMNMKGCDMKIELQRRDLKTRAWNVVARFEYGSHAMEAARALSEANGVWRVVDHRWPDEKPMTILYEDGRAH